MVLPVATSAARTPGDGYGPLSCLGGQVQCHAPETPAGAYPRRLGNAAGIPAKGCGLVSVARCSAAMETASLVISIIAALFAAGAVWYARGAKIAAPIRADTAKEVVGYQRAEVGRGRVVLRLRHIGGISYRLVNDGTDTAYAVHVDTGELGVGEQDTDYNELASGQAVGFFLSPNLAATSRHVSVTWHQRPDRSDEKRAARLII